jgi:hypothetical protein
MGLISEATIRNFPSDLQMILRFTGEIKIRINKNFSYLNKVENRRVTWCYSAIGIIKFIFLMMQCTRVYDPVIDNSNFVACEATKFLTMRCI